MREKREKTGYYDCRGKAIRDGDRLKATCSGGFIVRGVVKANEHGELFFKSGFCLQDLGNLQSVAKNIEILEEE